MNPYDFKAAHLHSANHRQELERSNLCACFHCLESFPPGQIDEWVDDEQTAMCPRCGVDSVLGDASGLPLAVRSWLEQMQQLYFGAE